MSEIMRPMPFAHLMGWAVAEYRQDSRIFGVQKEKFYKNTSGTGIEIFGDSIASPVGPAAGPNSQLAQNIIAAYLGGARFMELKTVQKMDGAELRACVPRPCINAEDEGYNVEWSTELTVQQAFDEYVKAWVALHLLGKETGIAAARDFVFNMSVGYDLAGIKTEKIDSYIEGMKDASKTPIFKEALAWARENLSLFHNITAEDIDSISPHVSSSVTLSTLHGCPPQEIENISKYLLEEKKVHTFVKCNPTLLGYEFARQILDSMGYEYVNFDDHHFKDDLQYQDAVEMLDRLMKYAAERSLSFGVKITNTFPVKIRRKELPGEEMYMSGRALFPLSISVANRLSGHFKGQLPISYSGGADAFNIADIFDTGIRPITVATTILKPGGYERLAQLANILEGHMATAPATINVAALDQYANEVSALPFYRKEHREVASRKTNVPLPLFDCFQAPCKEGGCPIEQQIPEYLKLVAEGRYQEAFAIIAIDNAVPSITGTICPHPCENKCTRIDYDESLHIRNAKLMAAEQAQKAFIDSIVPAPIVSGKKVAVVGAGPAGVAAALFLRRSGMQVTVLEKRDRPFGIVEYIIPGFRIPETAMQRDFEMARRAGVDFQFGVEVASFTALQDQYDYAIVATGAWEKGRTPVKEGGELVVDALEFLDNSKRNNCQIELGQKVAVIGGGDVAMDCARAARRAAGSPEVTIVYRRTKAFMPAEPEEIRLALADNVAMVELHAPLTYDGKTLVCEKMTLGDWDESGRRGIVGTGEEVSLSFDTVICAVGARVDSAPYKAAGLTLDERENPLLSATCESSLPGLYVIGDGRRGPATVVEAVADAKAVAKDILQKEGLAHTFTKTPQPQPLAELYGKKGLMLQATDKNTDGLRCLACDQLCEECCDVCPNRANVRIKVAGMRDSAQILHVDGMCNECGNCGTFCPHAGNPYKDKVTLFWSEEDFHDSQNRGFLKLAGEQYMIRLEDGSEFAAALSDARLPQAFADMIRTVEQSYSYLLA